jgi:hypothetical protein
MTITNSPSKNSIATGVLAPDQLLNTSAAISESTAMLRSNPPRK